jgi:hypothetical protein
MQEVLDGLHAAILVGLLFDQDRPGIEDPRLFVEVAYETWKKAVGVVRRDTTDIPVPNAFRGRIDETHGQVLYADVYT